MIETKNLTKTFDSFTAVDHLNLKIESGEFFGLLGPNGAGKTTTISLLSYSKDLSMAIYTRTSNPILTRVPLRLSASHSTATQSMNSIQTVSYCHTFPQDFISWSFIQTTSR